MALASTFHPLNEIDEQRMTFKKGEKVLTEDGQIGEILFIDRGGLEAQVALARISTKIRCDSLRKCDPINSHLAPSFKEGGH